MTRMSGSIGFSPEAADRWAGDRGFSKIGGIRTVICGESFVSLNTNANIYNFVEQIVDPATGLSYYSMPRNNNYASYADYGFFTWADALMGAPHYLIKNAGAGGENTDQILVRFDTDVIALMPELIYLSGGRNDFKQGKTADYVIANWQIMLDKCDSINAFVVMLDAPYGSNLNLTAGAVQQAQIFNNWLRDEARRRRQSLYVPVSAIIADPDVTSGNYGQTALLMTDATHYNNLGAHRIGAYIAKVMAPFIRPWSNFPVSPVNGWDFSNTDIPEIRSSNPFFAGTGGTALTGITGQVATGYEVGRSVGVPTCVASIVADRDNIGNAQRLAITFTAADEAVYLGVLTSSVHSRFVANRISELQCDLTFAASGNTTSINRIELVSSGVFNGNNQNSRGLSRAVTSDQIVSNNSQPIDLSGKSLRIRTPRCNFIGPCTAWQHFVRIYAANAGTVTVDVSRYALRQFVQS